MIKKLLIFMFLVILIVVGIGYAIVTDRDYLRQQIFIKTLALFTQQIKPLEKAFMAKKSLPRGGKTLTLTYQSSEGPQQIEIVMEIEPNLVRLIYTKTTDLAGETVLLEPIVRAQKVLWKCLNGSLLLRYRIKECRLGYAVDLNKLTD